MAMRCGAVRYVFFLCVIWSGAMLGKLEVEGGAEISAFTDPNERNLVSEVSITEPRVFGKGNPVKVSKHALKLG